MRTDEDGNICLTLVFDDEAERARFDALRASNPEADDWCAAGARQAEDLAIAALMRGVYGATESAIERNIAKVGRAGEKGLRRPGEGRVSVDLTFCYRIGFRSRCWVAMTAYLAQRAPVPPLPSFQAASHALALGSRPSSPQAFGALSALRLERLPPSQRAAGPSGAKQES